MAKKDLRIEKTQSLAKDIISETIDDITEVVKRRSKDFFKTMLEHGSENIGDLLDVCSKQIKKKVGPYEQKSNQKNK